MSERISTLAAHNSAVSGILTQEAYLSDLQSHVATGKRVNRPSDDPVAAAKITTIQQNIAELSDYAKNADSAKNNLELEESTLNTFNLTLQVIREKALYANNGSLSFMDRQSLAAEMQQRLDQLVALANTQDQDGHYIFSGYAGNTVPVVSNDLGQYSYAGDQGIRYTSLSSNFQMACNDNAGAVFFGFAAADLSLTSTADVTNTGTAAVDSFYVETTPPVVPESYVIVFNTPALPAPPSPATDFSIYDPSDLVNPLTDYANVPFVAGQEYAINGVEFSLSGVPAGADTFTLNVTQQVKQDVFTATQDLINAIVAYGSDNERLSYNIGVGLENLDQAEQQVLTTRATIGARLNAIDIEKSANSEHEILAKILLSEQEDLDLTKAISDLQLISVALQAAQQSFVVIRNLSIFTYL